MRDEYNIRELNPSKNPYTSKVKVTIDVEGSTLDYFESMAAVDGIPYQTLINLYLSCLLYTSPSPRDTR
mgnify:CR=1 FL=1